MQYTLVLSSDMVNVIAKAIIELPFKEAQPVFAELQKQVDDQNKALADAQSPIQDNVKPDPEPN